jgi:hypothetical protein
MKIFIEAGRTKRQITGPFNICGSRDDLFEMMDQLRTLLEDKSWSYGWVSIRGEKQKSIPGPGVGWDKQ